MDEKKTALIFKAFCDENRIRILKMTPDGETVEEDFSAEAAGQEV